jgi:hypothetical protein
MRRGSARCFREDTITFESIDLALSVRSIDRRVRFAGEELK